MSTAPTIRSGSSGGSSGPMKFLSIMLFVFLLLLITSIGLVTVAPLFLTTSSDAPDVDIGVEDSQPDQLTFYHDSGERLTPTETEYLNVTVNGEETIESTEIGDGIGTGDNIAIVDTTSFPEDQRYELIWVGSDGETEELVAVSV